MQITHLEHNNDYKELLKVVGSLSKLFSDNTIPYLYYRVAENIFCKAFNALNLARDDSAFDALLLQESEKLGVGLKTFTFKGTTKLEKIAEFNKISTEFITINNKVDLARKLAMYRNERINVAHRTYETTGAVYHLVARSEGLFKLFETDYDLIDIDNIKRIKETNTGLTFDDDKHEYSFNRSKSTLFRRFDLPSDKVSIIDINILDEPLSLLRELLDKIDKDKVSIIDNNSQNETFVILPLFSFKGSKHVPERSGINQWNANGRKRDINEVYIPVPIEIHKFFPNFFPSRDCPFTLKTPTGEELTAKICQENNKALMTNPNKAIADWLLRKVLNLEEGQPATLELLKKANCDSVKIRKISDKIYSITPAPYEAYETFVNQIKQEG